VVTLSETGSGNKHYQRQEVVTNIIRDRKW